MVQKHDGVRPAITDLVAQGYLSISVCLHVIFVVLSHANIFIRGSSTANRQRNADWMGNRVGKYYIEYQRGDSCVDPANTELFVVDSLIDRQIFSAY